MDKVPKASIDSNGFLRTSRRRLRADVLPPQVKGLKPTSSKELADVLTNQQNREMMNTFIQSFYSWQLFTKPSYRISRPSVLLAQFGTADEAAGRTTSQVFTEKGWRNGGVHIKQGDLRTGFIRHWNAVRLAGYTPEVRKLGDARKDEGVWLSLRKPTLPEVAENWFGYVEDQARKDKKLEVIERHISQPWDHESTRDTIRTYRELGEVAIDRNNYNPEVQGNQQIGLMIAIAALKNFVGDVTGAQNEAEDAIRYANYSSLVDVSAYRALDNSTHGVLSE